MTLTAVPDFSLEITLRSVTLLTLRSCSPPDLGVEFRVRSDPAKACVLPFLRLAVALGFVGDLEPYTPIAFKEDRCKYSKGLLWSLSGPRSRF
jgi:hypothetical protein